MIPEPFPASLSKHLPQAQSFQRQAGLHLVATPIGHLLDISLRALLTLYHADAILCEDTRHSRKLLQAYSITTPLYSYHDHSTAAQRQHILEKLQAGQMLALISDAGMPLIADPGYKLVQACHQHAIAVHAIPGANAALTALILAGLPTDAFSFHGFIPNAQQERHTFLHNLSHAPQTLIFYETGNRLVASLQAMQQIFGDRMACVCREITKLHEETRRQSLSTLIAHYMATPPRGEIVVIVAGQPPATETDETAVQTMLQLAMAHQPTGKAVADVAKASGWPRQRVYALALTLKNPPS